MTIWVPLMTTRSAGVMPDLITRKPSISGPVTTGRGVTLPALSATSTIFRAWSVWIAESGTSTAAVAWPVDRRMLPNMPGVRNWPALVTTARRRMVPERVSRLLSAKYGTVTFEKEAGFAGGARRRTVGVVRFLAGRYVAFQVIRAGPPPSPGVVAEMEGLVNSLRLQ